jgi:transposase-like protein
MLPHHVYYQLVILVLLWLCIMLPHLWPSPPGGMPTRPTDPIKTKRHRSRESKPFTGLTQKPHCAVCEQQTADRVPTPLRRPDPISPTQRRPHTVDTSRHFCPHTDCDYRGWLGLNNLRAHGHPSGGPWRQLQCLGCLGYFLETHGTIFHGKQAEVELIVRVLTCLAEGWGIRATARVFEVDANTVLHWLGAAAEQLRAFLAYFLCDVQALAEPIPTNGRGSARLWQQQSPAMAAGLTDHMWTLKEVLLYRVPPWPQPQTVSAMALVDEQGRKW